MSECCIDVNRVCAERKQTLADVARWMGKVSVLPDAERVRDGERASQECQVVSTLVRTVPHWREERTERVRGWLVGWLLVCLFGWLVGLAL